MAELRITHAVVELLRKGDPDLRITHGAVEVLRGGDPDLRITHAVVELLRKYACSWWVEDIEIRNWP